MNTEIIKEIDVQSVMTKSSLPVGGYSVNPYVGCPHACKYCYASFMKRFTGHTEPWGAFLDVKNWKPIANPHKYDAQKLKAYAATLARNICLNKQKHRQRHPFLRFLWGEEREETPMPEPAAAETPHSRLESEEMQRVYRSALARLPENQRKI